MLQIKTCRDCKAEKPLEDFPRNKGGVHGRQTYCRLCQNIRTKAWRQANPQKVRASRLKRYGITEVDFNKMSRRQEGRCAICSRERDLVIDHDHGTKRVRALLCHSCNRGLGMFHNSETQLRRAANYVAAHTPR